MTVKVLVLGLGALAASLCLASDDTHSSKDLVLAEVGGAKITYGDLETKNPAAVFRADTNYYEAERKALEDLIDDSLLQQQAAKEGLTVDQLLDKHVKSTLPKDPSDDVLRVYYEGLDTTQPFEAVRDKILDVLRDRRMTKAKTAYLQSLRKQSAIVLRLPPPRMPISMAGVPERGPAKAPVVLLEYADFECPVCQQVQPTVEKLEKEYQGKVIFAYKDFPLPMHADAEKAAEASHCAEAQGKYWEFHDMMLDQKRTDLQSLKDFAGQLHLDTGAFNKCLDSGAMASLVSKNLDEAKNLGLQGTPTFFVNGRYFNGNATYDRLRAVIDEELSAKENEAQATRGSREK